MKKMSYKNEIKERTESTKKMVQSLKPQTEKIL